jgi:glycosyltransferase involved in cell wall biosynthesis
VTSPLHITQIMLARGFGGAERSFVDLCAALTERGHRVQALCHDQFVARGQLEAIPGLNIAAVAVRGAFDWLAVRRLRRAIESFEPQIVQAHLARGALLAGRACGGLPLLVKTHNYVKLKYYRRVDHFVTTTEDQARYLRERGIDAGRVTVIPNFSRLAAVEPAAFAAPVRFISYGRLVHKKGFDVLLRAAGKLRDSGHRFHLTIGGAGPEAEALSRLCRDLQLERCVELAGWVDDVGACLDEGDVFVLPSRDEPFGIAVLEAMARGKPIVATRSRGPLEILDEGTAELVAIDDADALAKAMAGFVARPERARQLARAALERYRARYCAEVVVPRYEGVYRMLLQ